MLKFGGEAVIDWVSLICNLAWRQSSTGKWRKAVTVPLNNSKGSRNNCSNYIGIRMLNPLNLVVFFMFNFALRLDY